MHLLKEIYPILFLATPMNTPRWFIVHLLQEGKLKRLPRMIIVDTLALTVSGFETQLSSLCMCILVE